jgi:hypothetical protein
MLSWRQGHSTAGRITTMKNSNKATGNQTCDLPACSALPRPTTSSHVQRIISNNNKFQLLTVILIQFICYHKRMCIEKVTTTFTDVRLIACLYILAWIICHHHMKISQTIFVQQALTTILHRYLITWSSLYAQEKLCCERYFIPLYQTTCYIRTYITETGQ